MPVLLHELLPMNRPPPFWASKVPLLINVPYDVLSVMPDTSALIVPWLINVKSVTPPK